MSRKTQARKRRIAAQVLQHHLTTDSNQSQSPSEEVVLTNTPRLDMEKQVSQDNSFYSRFIPQTTKKAIIFLTIVGFVVYFNMLFNEFTLDDIVFILTNPGIHQFNFFYLIGGVNNLFSAFGQYRPIPALYFSTLYSLFSTTPFFYHLLQLLLHITNAVLIWVFCKRFFSKNIALLISLLFLVHPIQVESVSYIASSENPLFFLFGMAALILSTQENISVKRILISSGLIFLSLLTKETGALFIFLILLYRFLFATNRKLLPYIISLLVSVLLYSWIRFGLENVAVGNIDVAIVPLASLSFFGRLLSIPAIILFYLKTFFLPLNLSLEQYWAITRISVSQVYLPLTIDIIFFAVLIYFGIYLAKSERKKLNEYLFFGAWFILGIGIDLQLFPLDGTVSDKWFYFPIVGLLGLLGLLIQQIKFSNKRTLLFGFYAAATLVLLLSLRTIVRNSDWTNEDTLYKQDVGIYDDYVTEYYFGVTYDAIGQVPTALLHYEKAASFYPSELTLCSLGSTYLEMGNIKQAQYYCLQGLNSPLQNNIQHSQSTFLEIAKASILLHESAEAKKIVQLGLSEYPQSGDLWAMLAISNYELGFHAEAVHDAVTSNAYGSMVIPYSVYTQMRNNKPISL